MGTEIATFWHSPFAPSIQRAALENLRKTGLRTRADVEALLGWLKEPQVGTRHNCLEADHSAPFDFIADVLTGRVLNYIAWANRSGSKSYLAGLIAWVLSAFNRRLETTILGGSLDQSEKVYKAMKDIWTLTDLQDEYLEAEPTRRLSSWRNGSTVSVLTASTRSTRGPHPQHLIMDEIDEMPEEVYRAALSQPQSKHGISARLGQFSTNHRSGGMMDEALLQARLHATPIYRWCIWECLEPCRDYACSTCKISAWCPGTHMKQADGFYRVQDFVDKLEHLSENALQVEWLCRKIGRDDLVYGDQFDPAIHARGDLPGFDPGRHVLISLDWGGAAPFSLGAWQQFNIGWVRIGELYQPGTNPQLIREAQGQPWWGNIRGGVGDPSRPDLLAEWRAQGIPTIAADNDIDQGLEAVRKGFRPVIGPPTLWINPICRHWLTEQAGYIQKRGRPVKERDHAMDETRYFAMWQMKPPARKGRVFAGPRSIVQAAGPAPSEPHRAAVVMPIIGQARPPILTPDGISPDLSPAPQPAAPHTSPGAIDAPREENPMIQSDRDEATRTPGGEKDDLSPRMAAMTQENEEWPPRAGQARVPDPKPLRAGQGGAGEGPQPPAPPQAPVHQTEQKPAVGPVDANSGLEPIGGSNGKRKGRVFVPR